MQRLPDAGLANPGVRTGYFIALFRCAWGLAGATCNAGFATQLHDGRQWHVVPIVGVTAVSGSTYVLLRGKGKKQEGTRFTIQEDGVIGHLTHLGLSDDAIGEVLARSPESVERNGKAFGFSPTRVRMPSVNPPSSGPS
jgi:hypothetical protein